MSKPSRRPGREEFKQQRKKARKVRKALREKQQTQGLSPSRTATVANHACRYTSVEEEREARLEAVTEQARVMRANLPVLLRRLQRIADPRHPKKLKHQLTMLMLYGILSFVLQFASRREANRSLSRPQIKENLRLLFPELEEIPHQDTLNRLLERIEPEEIEAGQIELVRRLIRKKKFQPYLVEGCYPVAIDGTQKLVGRFCWTEQWLEREITTRKGPAPQYYVYVVEAYLVFRGGMNIPLMSEFLDYSQGDIQREKQDCVAPGKA